MQSTIDGIDLENTINVLDAFIGNTLIEQFNPGVCDTQRMLQTKRRRENEHAYDIIGMDISKPANTQPVVCDGNFVNCMKVEEWLTIYIDPLKENDLIQSRAIAFIRDGMENGSFAGNYAGLTLVYLDEDIVVSHSINNDKNVPVYVWVLSSSSFALFAAFVSIYKLRTKDNKELASKDEEEESYSDVSDEWSSNYNSHLWEEYDESENTPKRTNIKLVDPNPTLELMK